MGGNECHQAPLNASAVSKGRMEGDNRDARIRVRPKPMIEPTNGQKRSVARDFVLPETTTLVAIGCVDLLLTIYLIATRKAYEGNPLMMAVGNAFGVYGFVAAKALLLAVPLTIAELARRRNPVFVKKALRVGVILYVALLAYAWLPMLLGTPHKMPAPPQ